MSFINKYGNIIFIGIIILIISIINIFNKYHYIFFCISFNIKKNIITSYSFYNPYTGEKIDSETTCKEEINIPEWKFQIFIYTSAQESIIFIISSFKNNHVVNNFKKISKINNKPKKKVIKTKTMISPKTNILKIWVKVISFQRI